MTDTELRELLEMCEQATPGPWEAKTMGFVEAQAAQAPIASCLGGPAVYVANVALIAAARTVLPALVQELLAARAVVVAAQAIYDDMLAADSLDESYAVTEGVVRLSRALVAYDDRRTP